MTPYMMDKKILAIYKAQYPWLYDMMLDYGYSFQAMVAKAKEVVSYIPDYDWFRLYIDEDVQFNVDAYTLEEWLETGEGAAYGIPDEPNPTGDAVTIDTPDGRETFIVQ